jgi:hypothetical protein
VEKRQLFNKCCWEKCLSACRKLKVDPHLPPCTTINSKWIKDLNIRSDTLKQLQEVEGKTLVYTGIGNGFLSRTLIAQQIRERMNKWDCIKLKSFCTAKETVKTQETAHRMGENLCQPATYLIRDFADFLS